MHRRMSSRISTPTSQAATQLAQQIADSLGVELEVVDMAFDSIIPAKSSPVRSTSALLHSQDPRRAEEIDFSNLYETSAQLLIVKTGVQTSIPAKEALAGQKIRARRGHHPVPADPSPHFPTVSSLGLKSIRRWRWRPRTATLQASLSTRRSARLGRNQRRQARSLNFQFTAEEASFGKAAVIAKEQRGLCCRCPTRSSTRSSPTAAIRQPTTGQSRFAAESPDCRQKLRLTNPNHYRILTVAFLQGFAAGAAKH